MILKSTWIFLAAFKYLSDSKPKQNTITALEIEDTHVFIQF